MALLNLGILAHVDAGKTTTVEQMLYRSGKLRALGFVDKGNTQTDFLAVERERGISVTAATVDMMVEGIRVSVIDTPGHMDFTGEVERSLSVLDGAVLLVSAAEGIQSQTERFWKALRTLSIPTLIFVNKIDRAGCEPDQVLKSLQTQFSPAMIPLNHYHQAGQADAKVEACSLSDDSLLELCENDSDLATRYLAGETLSEQMIHHALKTQTKNGLAFPLLYGASVNSVGIDLLMHAIATYLPTKPLLSTGEPVGIVYKIEHDKTLGKIAHVRLYNGTLANRDLITIHRPHGESFQEKITQIRKVSGAKREDVSHLYGNEVAALCGLAGAKVGDMVGQRFEQHNLRLAEPLYAVRVHVPTGQERALLIAVAELAAEEPLMNYNWNHDVRELIIHIMGKIQLEIIGYLLLERYGLAVTFSPPTVIYKETPASRGIGLEAYTMPKPCWAIVQLQVDPFPRGAGYRFRSLVADSRLQERYQNHVKTAILDTLKQGRLGWEVTDIGVSLIDGEDHTFHTHPMDFFLATPIALMKALEDAGSQLLEPLVKLRLVADATLAGKLIGDIVTMRGTFDSPVISSGKVTIEAIVPASASMDYAIQFASLTSGRGLISVDFHGFAPCPLALGVTATRRGIDPLDRAKWILHKRGALQ